MKATVVLAGSRWALRKAVARHLLAAGASVLQAATSEAALRHLEGGLVDVVVYAGRTASAPKELKSAASALRVPILPFSTTPDPSELLALLRKVLRR